MKKALLLILTGLLLVSSGCFNKNTREKPLIMCYALVKQQGGHIRLHHKVH